MTKRAEGWDAVQASAHCCVLPGPAPCRVNNSAGQPRQEASRPGCRPDSGPVQRRAGRALVGGVHLLHGWRHPHISGGSLIVLGLGKLRPRGSPCTAWACPCPSGMLWQRGQSEVPSGGGRPWPAVQTGWGSRTPGPQGPRSPIHPSGNTAQLPSQTHGGGVTASFFCGHFSAWSLAQLGDIPSPPET